MCIPNKEYSTTEVMLIGTLTTEPAKDSNLMMPTPKNPFLKQYWTSAKMVLYQMRGMIPRIPRIPKCPKIAKIPKIPVILIQNEIGQAPLFPASCDIHVSTSRIKSIVMVANIATSITK